MKRHMLSVFLGSLAIARGAGRRGSSARLRSRSSKRLSSPHWFAAILFMVTALHAVAPSPVRAQVVISQVYGGGGNSGSQYPNDFVELFNTSDTDIDLSTWSLHYGSATLTTWSRTILNNCIPTGNCVIPAHHYFLVRFAAGNCAPNPLPSHDATGTTNLSATSGKVALTASTGILPNGACPVRPQLKDFIGYGVGTQMCAEGAAPTPKLANDTAALRLSRGCDDTDNNRNDFFLHNPNPRNRSSPENLCTVQALLAIHDIQGSGTSSPHVGEMVQTEGVVTARTGGGFFIQVPDKLVDADPNTSEAIRVDTVSPPPAEAAVGNLLQVTGRVEERVPQFDIYSPTPTVIWGSVGVKLLDTNQKLPTPYELTAADTPTNGSIQQLERLEHMRVHVASLTTTSGTAGRLDEDNATSESFGSFFGTITGLVRTFREPGIEADDPIPMPPCCIPRFDGNPEHVRVDTKSQGGPTLEVTTGTVLTNLTGPIDYAFRSYTIVTDTPPPASGGMTAQPLGPAGADRFRVVTFNMRRFFDTTKDPNLPDDEPVLTEKAYDNRLKKSSLVIRTYLRYPDILGVQEVENIGVLTDIANRVNADAIAAGDPDPQYFAYLIEGQDFGGIDVGFLVKTARVAVLSVQQFGITDMFTSPPPCPRTSRTNDRPPLVLRAEIARDGGGPFPVTVIVNHLRSFFGVSDPVDGPWVRAKRRAQAEFLANLIQARQTADPNERIIVVGDFNNYQFNDGYVDSLGTIRGDPTDSDHVLVPSPDLVEPNLILLAVPTAAEQYSSIFNGNAAYLDHILVTQNLADTSPVLRHGRFNSDFPQSFGDDPMRPERFTDHDILVTDFTLPPRAGLAVRKTAPASVVSGAPLTYTIRVSNNGPQKASEVVLRDVMPLETVYDSVRPPSGWSCEWFPANIGDIVLCKTPSLAPGVVAAFELTVKVAQWVPQGRILVNSASVSARTEDPDFTDNVSEAKTYVLR